MKIPRQNARLVLQNHLEGNDPACHHVLERRDAVAVLIKRAAADADSLCRDVDLVRLARLEHALGLRDLAENFRQSGGIHNEVFWSFFHAVHLVCLC